MGTGAGDLPQFGLLRFVDPCGMDGDTDCSCSNQRGSERTERPFFVEQCSTIEPASVADAEAVERHGMGSSDRVLCVRLGAKPVVANEVLASARGGYE